MLSPFHLTLTTSCTNHQLSITIHTHTHTRSHIHTNLSSNSLTSTHTPPETFGATEERCLKHTHILSVEIQFSTHSPEWNTHTHTYCVILHHELGLWEASALLDLKQWEGYKWVSRERGRGEEEEEEKARRWRGGSGGSINFFFLPGKKEELKHTGTQWHIGCIALWHKTGRSCCSHSANRAKELRKVDGKITSNMFILSSEAKQKWNPGGEEQHLLCLWQMWF